MPSSSCRAVHSVSRWCTGRERAMLVRRLWQLAPVSLALGCGLASGCTATGGTIPSSPTTTIPASTTAPLTPSPAATPLLPSTAATRTCGGGLATYPCLVVPPAVRSREVQSCAAAGGYPANDGPFGGLEPEITQCKQVPYVGTDSATYYETVPFDSAGNFQPPTAYGAATQDECASGSYPDANPGAGPGPGVERGTCSLPGAALSVPERISSRGSS